MSTTPRKDTAWPLFFDSKISLLPGNEGCKDPRDEAIHRLLSTSFHRLHEAALATKEGYQSECSHWVDISKKEILGRVRELMLQVAA